MLVSIAISPAFESVGLEPFIILSVVAPPASPDVIAGLAEPRKLPVPVALVKVLFVLFMVAIMLS
jgi:phage shock protein PspC (stress-responsive transcriptional regulator)